MVNPFMIKRLISQFSKLSGSIPLAILWLLTSFYYLYIGLRVFIFPLSIPAVSLQQPPSLPQQEQIQISPPTPQPPLISEELIYQPGLETIPETIIITSIFFLFGLFTLGSFVPKKILKVVVSILSIVLAAEFTPVYNYVIGTYSEVLSPAGILVSIIFAFWSRSYLSSFLVAFFSTSLMAQPLFHISYHISQTIAQGFFNYWISTLSNLDLQIAPHFVLSLVLFNSIFSLPATLTVFLLHHWQKISNLPVLSNRLVRYIFIAVLISPFIYLFVIQPFIYRLTSSLPPIPPSSLDDSQGQTLEVYVVDAITKEPIAEVQVMAEEMIVCPEMIGYPCPKGEKITQATHQNGRVTLNLNKDKTYTIAVTHPSYMSSSNESQEYDPETNTTKLKHFIAFELVSKELNVKSREEAIVKAKEIPEIRDWLSQRSSIGESAKFTPPHWTVEFNSKESCSVYIPSDPNCTVFIQIHAVTGEVRIISSPLSPTQ